MQKHYNHDFNVGEKFDAKIFKFNSINRFELMKISDKVIEYIRTNELKNYEITVDHKEKFALITYNI